MKMDDLTGFQRDLLYVIAPLDSPHGVLIKETIEEYYTKEVNQGQLYPSLDSLVEEGLLEKDEIDKRTNSYQITEQGVQEIKARREWEDQYIQAE